jgi:hypothetical protein
MTHTPGPWRVRPSSSTKSEIIGNGAQILSGSLHVASVSTKADKPIYQKVADARLIAAAPDLLAALLELNNWSDHLAHCNRTVGIAKCNCGLAEVDRKVEAAILKATSSSSEGHSPSGSSTTHNKGDRDE